VAAKPNLSEQQLCLEPTDISVDVWVDTLRATIESQQVNRIVRECIDNLSSIAQSSVQSALTEAVKLQSVSQCAHKLTHIVSSRTDASTRNRIDTMQSILQDSALSVKAHTDNILGVCHLLSRVDQDEAPSQNTTHETVPLSGGKAKTGCTGNTVQTHADHAPAPKLFINSVSQREAVPDNFT